jgi:hypothetical protein
MASNETREKRFRHVISLGGTCRVAGILRSYGLRDGSYPFDWNTGSPEVVVRLVETGFRDFLRPGALVAADDVVCDTGSGVCMPNDFDLARPVAAQESAVRSRYVRRIARFRSAVTEPTLFVRRAWDDAELDWLLAHAEEVLTVLRRSNPGNALVVVTAEPPEPGGRPLPVYGIDDGDFRRLLRGLRYPARRRLNNLVRHHAPLVASRVRARAALRTRARRLAVALRLRRSAARSC